MPADSTGLAPGDHTGDLLVDSNDPDTPQVVVPVTLSVLRPAQVMFVHAISMDYLEPQPGRYLVRARVRIIERGAGPVEGATVDVEWTLPNGASRTQQRLTNPPGWAPFRLGSRLTGTYEICVTNVTKAGHHDDPAQNTVTRQQITVP